MSQNNAFWLHCKEEAILILIELILLYGYIFKLSKSDFVENIDIAEIFFSTGSFK